MNRRQCFLILLGSTFLLLLRGAYVAIGSEGIKAYLKLSRIEDSRAQNYSNVQKLIEASSVQRGTCNIYTNASWNHWSNTSNIRDSDWTFTQRVTCPDLNILQVNSLRQKALISCKNGRPEMFMSQTTSSSDIQFFEPGDECLHSYVRHCCHDDNPVPNVMHYIWIADVEVSFFTFVSFVSVLRFFKPCLIIFHGPYIPKGQFWDFFIERFPYVVSVNESVVTSIYGHKMRYIEHSADVMRIKAVLEYGGVYMDWDSAVVKSLEPLRKTDCSMSMENAPKKLGNQFIMSKRDGEFLKLYLDGYRNYTDAWTYNSIQYPFILSKRYPNLIKVWGRELVVSSPMSKNFLWHKNSNWSKNYALHFLLRGYKNKAEVTPQSIRTLKTTIAAHRYSERFHSGSHEVLEINRRYGIQHTIWRKGAFGKLAQANPRRNFTII